MAKKPNFRALRSIPIEQVCDYLGLSMQKKGAQYRGRCPLCRHPSDRAFTVTPLPTNRWWCWGRCRSGGDGLELVARYKRITIYAAALELQKLF